MASGTSTYDEVLSVLLHIDGKDLKDMDSSISKLDGLFRTATGTAKTFIGTLAAIDAGIIALGVAAARKAADFEALEISLIAVEGSAKKAKQSLAELRDIARGPGLGVQSAIETYSGLKRGGLDHDLAMSITKEIGNAIAYTGGGREELSRIGIALAQIAVSPTLKGQDVMQLAQARLPVYQALKNQFGTADPEELAKMGITSAQALKALRDEFAKLPRVAGGAKNAFENIGDAIEYAEVQIGKGINESIMPYVNDLTDVIDKLSGSGELKDFGSSVTDVFIDIIDSITGGGGSAQSVIDGVMLGLLTITYASRNFVMNLQDMWTLVNPLIGGILGKRLLNAGSGKSPFEQAQEEMAGIENMKRMREGMTMHGRLVSDGHGGQKRQIEVSPGVWIDEDKVTDAQKKSAQDYWRKVQGTDVKDRFANDPAKETVHVLKDIRENTRPIVRFMDLILGGGAAIKGGASVHNLAGYGGGGGSNRHIRMIMEGLQGLQGEMGANIGRGVNPKSF